MPKATLLRPEHATFSFAFGRTSYTFHGDQAREVPVAVALELQKKKDRKGKGLFRIEELPTIVSESDGALKAEQNVRGKSHQTRIDGWH